MATWRLVGGCRVMASKKPTKNNGATLGFEATLLDE